MSMHACGGRVPDASVWPRGLRQAMLVIPLALGLAGCGTGTYDEKVKSQITGAQAKFESETVRVAIAGNRPAELVFQAPIRDLADPAAAGATDPKLDWPAGISINNVPIQVRRGFVKAADNASYAYEWFYAAGEIGSSSLNQMSTDVLPQLNELVPDAPGAWSNVQLGGRYWQNLHMQGTMPFRMQDGAQPSGTYAGTSEVYLVEMEGYFVLIGTKCIDTYLDELKIPTALQAAIGSAKVTPR